MNGLKVLLGIQRDKKGQFVKGMKLAPNQSPKWKGGSFINSNGYREVRADSHPNKNNKGYVMEHRLVMEEIIGRYLRKTEYVHHINQNKLDNRPENLHLLSSKSEHSAIHLRDRVNSQRKTCPECGTVFQRRISDYFFGSRKCCYDCGKKYAGGFPKGYYKGKQIS